MIWLTTQNPEILGIVPSFLNEDDPRPAHEQINDRYISGWHPMSGFKMDDRCTLFYSGDPPLPAIAMTMLRDERITFYSGAWLAITQPDGTFEVGRVD
jgi:hypothetical protein